MLARKTIRAFFRFVREFRLKSFKNVQLRVERVRRVHDPETGLLAFIGVHNRNLGPALGGCRMISYANEKDDAFTSLVTGTSTVR